MSALSIGIRVISPVDSFLTNSPPNLPIVLIIFLGYEGDRTRAIYERFEPDKTILIVPKPAYHLEWEGKTEEMNDSIIRIVGRDNLETAKKLIQALQEAIEQRYFEKYENRIAITNNGFISLNPHFPNSL